MQSALWSVGSVSVAVGVDSVSAGSVGGGVSVGSVSASWMWPVLCCFARQLDVVVCFARLRVVGRLHVSPGFWGVHPVGVVAPGFWVCMGCCARLLDARRSSRSAVGCGSKLTVCCFARQCAGRQCGRRCVARHCGWRVCWSPLGLAVCRSAVWSAVWTPVTWVCIGCLSLRPAVRCASGVLPDCPLWLDCFAQYLDVRSERA